MINSLVQSAQVINLNEIFEFSKFILINILAWQFGAFVGHKLLPILEPVLLPICEKIFYKTTKGQLFLQKVNKYHDLKHAKTEEYLELTSSMQSKIDFAKSRFEYLTLEEQASVDECQVMIDNLRGEILKDLIGNINH